MYNCKILADSISDHDHRLTTFQITYPRIIHSEVMTHGMLVRNSESSRARPVQKNIDDVRDNPFIPTSFGKNQPGMQWSEPLQEQDALDAALEWGWAIEHAVDTAEEFATLGVHKSLANRVLEPYKWHTAIYSGTDWDNFFALRTHPDAQPEFRTIAEMMQGAYQQHDPQSLKEGQWHLPLVTNDELRGQGVNIEIWKRISIGRCARVSYLTHDGKRDPEADIALHDRLLESGHMSPFGHVARPFSQGEWTLVERAQASIGDTTYNPQDWEESQDGPSGGVPFQTYYEFGTRLKRNLEYCAQFHGWWQARADIPNEDNFAKVNKES